MKTIDLLVQALPAIGGWPEKVTHIGQDYDRELMFYGRVNVRTGIILDQLAVDHRKCGEAGVKITREQYEAALAAKNEGWIEWGGGECPVSDRTIVEVRYRNGEVKAAAPADFYEWVHGRPHFVTTGRDIIAYRLHKPQEATKADDESDLNECIGQGVATAWNGEGRPTIGTKCEHHSGGQWEVVTIAGIYENLVTGFTDYWMVKEDGCSYTVGNPYRFRPIRSEADKKREEAIMSIAKAGGAASFKYGEKFNDGSLIGAAWYELYDAIAAGKVRGVKLED
ncbi:hypothetical protein PRB79_gp11 [Klebsiella phage VLCpiS13d]|uniref:hypothetical protein n=1 Tax=Klebsiella phage VLCpiS13d TaxID=2874888 RepID=UPI00233EBEBC|nr:hypothetical protein PRB79_gp11 [Klebsiella phage VLCpiS13d]UVX31675.1 hypothetical protein S13d_00011 [Klebsiella phage VLCpiS13d]